ncbi:MAG TPA: NAD(P)H-binding protein [Gemmatimonadales bacterium]|nr:NAD(P)H-binding protein [Gemmatimonadales bacterium]
MPSASTGRSASTTSSIATPPQTHPNGGTQIGWPIFQTARPSYRNLEMKIALFGATGRTGGLLMERALSAGHEVMVLVRDPSKLTRPQEGLQVITGDARGASAVADTVQGTDVVISALGSGGDTVTLFGRNVMAAMERLGVRRIVSLVGASVVMPGDLPSMSLRMLRLITRVFGGTMLKDGEAHARELAASHLEYTLVRPPRLTDGVASGRIQHGLTLKLGPTSSISRADLAAFLLEVAVEGRYIRAAPMVAGLH